jgi:hypothetical protein
MSAVYCGYCGNRIEGRYPFCPYCSAPEDGADPPLGLMLAAQRLTPGVRDEINRLITERTPVEDLRRTLVGIYTLSAPTENTP